MLLLSFTTQLTQLCFASLILCDGRFGKLNGRKMVVAQKLLHIGCEDSVAVNIYRGRLTLARVCSMPSLVNS